MKAHAWKACVRSNVYREFESHLLRQIVLCYCYLMSSSAEAIAIVPYNYGRSLIFYPNYLKDGETVVRYADITELQLTNRSFTQLLLFIPLFKTRTIGLRAGTVSMRKALSFHQSFFSPFALPLSRLKDLDLIYKEVFSFTVELILPHLVKNLVRQVRKGNVLTFGSLTISEDSIRLTKAFGRYAELAEYGGCKVHDTYVHILDGQGGVFYSVSLFEDNALALPTILEVLFRG